MKEYTKEQIEELSILCNKVARSEEYFVDVVYNACRRLKEEYNFTNKDLRRLGNYHNDCFCSND